MIGKRERLERLDRLDRLSLGEGDLLRPLDSVAAERRLKQRDCRTCRNYAPAADGLGYGWCVAHEQYVKLYHPAEDWYSQCLFKGIRRLKPSEWLASRPAPDPDEEAA